MTDSVNKAFVDAEQVTTVEEILDLVPNTDQGDLDEQVNAAVSEVFEFLGRLEADDPNGDQKLADFLVAQYGTAFIAGCYYTRQKMPSQSESAKNEISVYLDTQERVDLARALLADEGISLRIFG
jgi:hypothetical protein